MKSISKPSKIYKYQPFSIFSIRNLKNNQLYFSHPSDFNDPYDCIHPISFTELSPNKVIEEYLSQKDIPNLDIILHNLFDNCINVDDLISLIIIQKNDDPQFINAIYAVYPFDLWDYENSLKKLFQDPIIFSIFKDFIRDGFFYAFNSGINSAIEEIRTRKFSEIGISCFSEIYDNMLMWSHYGDGHRGFCLEFDTNFLPFSKMLQVKYIENIPQLKLDDMVPITSANSELLLKTLIANKLADWCYEREWRVLHPKKNSLYGYETKALTAIYFGSKVEMADIEIIALIIKGHSPNISLFKMEMLPNKIELIAKKVTYRSHSESKIVIQDIVRNYFTGKEFDAAMLLNQFPLLSDAKSINKILNILVQEGILEKSGDNYIQSANR